MSTTLAPPNSNQDSSDSCRAILDHAAIGIAKVSLDGTFLEVNPHYCTLTGYQRHELIGTRFQTISCETELAENLWYIDEVLSGSRNSFTLEKRYRCKNGSLIWTSLTASLVRDQNGTPSFFVSTVQNITDRKNAEQRLKEFNQKLEKNVATKRQELAKSLAALESEVTERRRIQHALIRREAELKIIMDGVPAAIAYLDTDMRYRFHNAAHRKWASKADADLIGHKICDVISEEAFRAIFPHLELCLQGKHQDFDTFFSLHDCISHANVMAMPDVDENEEVRGIILLIVDITPRVAHQNDVEAARILADSANHQKSAFLAHMSHELRTPVGVILGYVDLMLREYATDLTEDLETSLNTIKRNSELLLRIVNANLDLAKAESKGIEVELESVDLVELTRDVVLGLGLQATKKGIELKVSYIDPLPSRIVTDPHRLRQILLNIVGNAIKFTFQGSVTLAIKQRTDAKGLSLVDIEVTDTGIGLDRIEAAKIFSAFSQGSTATGRIHGGTGLGLVLARHMAQALGGDITLVSSAPGKGSSFLISISAVGTRAEQSSHSHGEEFFKSALPQISHEFDGARILVADDTDEHRAITVTFLRQAGASVDSVRNGQECLERFREAAYDLVLLDINMPDLDGYEVMRRLRQKGFVRPILALTASAMPGESTRSLREGFDDHVTKPISRASLISRVARHHSSSRPKGSSADP